MKRDTDLITTIAGVSIAIGSAAQVAVGQIAPGASMHSGDWLQLLFAVGMAVFGFFTNKQPKP